MYLIDNNKFGVKYIAFNKSLYLIQSLDSVQFIDQVLSFIHQSFVVSQQLSDVIFGVSQVTQHFVQFMLALLTLSSQGDNLLVQAVAL